MEYSGDSAIVVVVVQFPESLKILQAACVAGRLTRSAGGYASGWE